MKKTMKGKLILAVDAAIENGSLSLTQGQKEFGSQIFGNEGSRSVDLLPGIQELIERHGFDVNSLDLLAVSKTYGSLTGLRVAAATLRGLGSALNIKVFEYDLLQIIARQISAGGNPRIVGVPVGKNSAEWLWTDGQVSKIHSTDREVRKIESFLGRFFEANSSQICVHETLFKLLENTKFAGNPRIQNLGLNMSHYLAVEAAKI